MSAPAAPVDVEEEADRQRPMLDYPQAARINFVEEVAAAVVHRILEECYGVGDTDDDDDDDDARHLRPELDPDRFLLPGGPGELMRFILAAERVLPGRAIRLFGDATAATWTTRTGLRVEGWSLFGALPDECEHPMVTAAPGVGSIGVRCVECGKDPRSLPRHLRPIDPNCPF